MDLKEFIERDLFTAACRKIPEEAKVEVSQQALVQLLEYCWHQLVQVQRNKQLLDDKMKGLEQFEDGWREDPENPGLSAFGVPPTIQADMLNILWQGMGENARLACEQILLTRKALLDKTPV